MEESRPQVAYTFLRQLVSNIQLIDSSGPLETTLPKEDSNKYVALTGPAIAPPGPPPCELISGPLRVYGGTPSTLFMLTEN